MKKKSILASSILLLALLLGGCNKNVIDPSTSDDSEQTVSSEEIVNVTGVNLASVSSDTLTIGDTLQLDATVSPENATDKTVSWTSSNTSVASVSDAGLVTALDVGDTTITVSTTDGEFTDDVLLHVVAPVVHVTGVTLSTVSSTGLFVDDTLQLEVTVLPENATDKTVSWTSTDTDVASVSDTGLVTALSKGTTTITVTSTDGGLSDSVTLNVSNKIVHVTSVTVSASKTTIEVDETLALGVTVLPENATDSSVTWASSNSSVATVSESGVVTGVSSGEAIISATSTDGNLSDSVTIRVEKHYSITTPNIDGVTVVAPASALAGEYIEVEVSSSTLLIDAVYANTTKCGMMNGKYFFFMPEENVEISVSTSVASISHAINNGNSSVVTLSSSSAKSGEEVTVSFTIAPGYDLSTVIVNGNITAFDVEDFTVIESTVTGNSVTFVMPDEDVLITVNVTAHEYSISVVDTYGSLSAVAVDGTPISKIGGKYHAPYNSTVKFTFYGSTSSSAYKMIGSGIKIVETNTVYSVDSEGATTVTFTMPHRNITAEILTNPVYRNITLNNSEHITLGLFSKVDDNYVALSENKAIYEETVYVKATASDDYEVNSLTGTYLSATSSSSFTSTLTINAINSDGFYSFTMPLSRDASCTLTVTECYGKLFEGEDCVGNYVGFNWYSNNFYHETNGSNSLKTASIALSGKIVHKSTSTALAASIDENGTITATDGTLFHYESNILVSKYTPSSSGYTGSDMMIYFKLEEGKTVSDYTYTFACLNSSFFVCEVYNSDGLYASALYDVANNTLYFDVSFVFETGTRINEVSNGSIYDSEGKYLIDFSSTGSKVSFFANDGYKGTYTDDGDNELVLDGSGTATYQGSSWAYAAGEDGVTITLSNYTSTNKNVVVVTIDKANKTFVLVSSDSEELPQFTGNMYSSKSSNNWYYTLNFTTPGSLKMFAGFEFGDTSGQWNATVTSWNYDSETSTLTVNMSNATTLVATYDSESDTFTLVGTFSSIPDSYGSLSDGAVFTKLS
ncbi:MAG: Ig domain-containing protein [Bacilli bacterium]